MKSKILPSVATRFLAMPLVILCFLLAGHFNSLAQSCVTAPVGLIHWWDGDAVAGTTATDLIGGSDGTMLFDVTTATGMVGNAFSFDGSQDVISTPVLLNYTNGISFDVWVRGTGFIMGDGGGASLQRGMSLTIEGGFLYLIGTHNIGNQNNFVIRIPAPDALVFHHIVATWTGDNSGGGVALYIDGKNVGTTTAINSIAPGDFPLCIGGHTDPVLYYVKFNGLIDEAKIYNRALTADEVAAIFGAGSEGICKTNDCGDKINPTASNPAPVTVQCISDVPAADITVVTDEADNIGAPVVAFVSDVSNGATCPEIITRTYSVTDACLNQILVTQTITVKDDINPTASNPAPLTVQHIGDVPAADITVVIDEADNCGVPVVAFVSDVSNGATYPEIITRTYSVTDVCLNQILVTQTITVDNINEEPDCNCGKNKEKVMVCHKGFTICISKNALQAHLKHGDKCGPCDAQAKLKSIGINNKAISIDSNNEFLLYPNPFDETIQVQLPEGFNHVSLGIYDMLGRVVKKVDSLNSTTFGVNLSELQAGFYYFTISDDTGLLESGKISKK